MTTRDSARIRIGCSGWLYKHWRGDFYPESLPTTKWLEHYVRSFDTVELNNSFYRLPEASTFEAWRLRAPTRFLFAVKASRYLTHLKRLIDPIEPLERLFERARHLGPAFGPVLYQLPPRWSCQPERFHEFLESLPADHEHAVEFREADWYRDDILEDMAHHRVALCVHDMTGSEAPRRRIGPFVYLRLHGAGARYGGRYPDDTLDSWADWLGETAAEGRPAYVYFNNDVGGHAPRDAVRLRERLSRRA